MAMNARRHWLISYDIANPKRLSRLHRFLLKHATPIQYSVFCYEGSAATMGQLMAAIENRIDAKADDVRGYLLPEPLQLGTLGRGALPAGVLLESDLSPALRTLLQAAGKGH